jgi:hypothetical protein
VFVDHSSSSTDAGDNIAARDNLVASGRLALKDKFVARKELIGLVVPRRSDTRTKRQLLVSEQKIGKQWGK